MEENFNQNMMRLSEQLPKHSPDPGAWDRLSSRLDMLDAEAAYQEKLQGLPVHSPNEGMWEIISRRLNRVAYLRTSVRIALTAAAAVLIFFTVSQVIDYSAKTTSAPGVARQEFPKPQNQAIEKGNLIPDLRNEAPEINAKTSSKTIKRVALTSASSNSLQPGNTGMETVSASTFVIDDSTAVAIAVSNFDSDKMFLTTVPADSAVTSKFQSADSAAFIPPPFYLYLPLSQSVLGPKKPIYNPGLSQSTGIQNNQEASPLLSPEIANSATKTNGVGHDNHFALAMGYLPENIYNGTENTVFYNMDLTASYNKEKIRFNTSVGMAYNEDQFEVNMHYDINSAVTAIGPNGYLDTLSYNKASLQSDYVGTEKHQYFTYNLGMGARLFGYRKFTTWFNAGAGFGLLLNSPDLVSATENSVKNQFNANITGVSTDKPVYNDVNVNFVTGIDFNYAVIKRLSISFSPTSRWYFKPMLSKNNQATDELTFGFKTGLKFVF